MTSQLSELIHDLESEVVPLGSPEQQVHATSKVLGRFLRSGFVFPEVVRPKSTCYSRFLLHRDPADRFVVVAMVWGSKQMTSIHDHDGVWCVEGVFKGELEITQYEMEPVEGDCVHMRAHSVVHAGPHSMGNLIPPFEHHRIHNPHPDMAISVHVYGRELKTCRRFVEQPDGSHRPEIVPLSYDMDLMPTDQPVSPVSPLDTGAAPPLECSPLWIAAKPEAE